MTQPISMPWSAPAFTKPPHRWQGVRIAAMPFTPQPGAVERILPPGMERADGPGMIALISYPRSEFHPYNELVDLRDRNRRTHQAVQHLPTVQARRAEGQAGPDAVP